MKVLLNNMLDMLHILFCLMPIGIFFMPKKYFWLTKIIILFLLLTPLHWEFFNDYCVLSWISIKMGSLSNTNHDAPFTEKYLSWIIDPVFNLLNIKKNSESLNKFVYFQWTINFLIVYYYIFYHLKCTIR
jgi:hypothetical protein